MKPSQPASFSGGLRAAIMREVFGRVEAMERCRPQDE